MEIGGWNTSSLEKRFQQVYTKSSSNRLATPCLALPVSVHRTRTDTIVWHLPIWSSQTRRHGGLCGITLHCAKSRTPCLAIHPLRISPLSCRTRSWTLSKSPIRRPSSNVVRLPKSSSVRDGNQRDREYMIGPSTLLYGELDVSGLAPVLFAANGTLDCHIDTAWLWPYSV